MLKMGLQKEAIAAKMKQEGRDPSVLEKSPDELVSLEEESITGTGDNKPAAPSIFAGIVKKKGPIVRKKKLHWKALDASKVGQDSLWADKDDETGITIDDEAEFNQLFVERYLLFEY